MTLLHDIQADEKLALSFFFRISMWWRIVYGTLRFASGAALLKLIGTPFIDIFNSLMSHELTQDPHDLFYTFVYGVLEDHTFTVTYFVASYLIFWGIIDVVLSICLLRHKLWAFPASIGFISLFILYEAYRFFIHTHSLTLLWIVLVDCAILYIIFREYQILRTERGKVELSR